jgi:hypothetical protein
MNNHIYVIENSLAQENFLKIVKIIEYTKRNPFMK